MVLGCLEGVFAQGHVYVLVSRVTDPANFCLVGLPPWDILEELAAALRNHGLDFDQVFERSVRCSNEFIYDPCRSGGLKDRFAQKYNSQRTIPITWRSLSATLNPQPLAFSVIKRVLDWIDRCDEASKQNLPAPPFRASDGGPIFPLEESEDYLWWVTDASRNQNKDEQKGDEDGPQSSEESEAQDEGERKADDALVSDSDPDSSRSEWGNSQSQTTVVLPVRYDTRPLRDQNCAWASRRS